MHPHRPFRCRSFVSSLLFAWLVASGIVASAEVNSAGTIYEVTTLTGPQLSPDGRWVAFETQKPDASTKSYRSEFVIGPVDAMTDAFVAYAAPRQEATRRFAGESSLDYRWLPDSKRIAVRMEEGWRVLEIASRTWIPLLAAGPAADLLKNTKDVEFSPDGAFVALAMPEPSVPTPVDLTVGVELDLHWTPFTTANRNSLKTSTPSSKRLRVVELATGHVVVLTPANQDVGEFDWSPDSSRLVYSAIDDPTVDKYPALCQDLYLVDRAGACVSALVQLPGGDSHPVWSPDGAWIAFGSQAGVPNFRYNKHLAIVASRPGAIPAYPYKDHPADMSLGNAIIGWAADSRSIWVSPSSELQVRLIRVQREGERFDIMTNSDSLEVDSEASYSAQGDCMVYVRESAVDAAELYLFRAGKGQAVQLTHYNDVVNSRPKAKVEVIGWRSADDKWNVHGMVLQPVDFDPRRRYPLMVYVEGGPQMVRGFYGITSQYPLLTFVEQGYVVFIPNTRGRGGYGPAFDAAIETEGRVSSGPYQDIVSGVDALVARGYIDPDRMGITGFSYGSKLCAYTITQTNRFRAAAFNGTGIEIVSTALKRGGLGWYRDISLGMGGFRDIYDPVDRLRADQESGIGNVARWRTPSLVTPGIDDGTAVDGGYMLLNAGHRFNVPVEFVVYPRSGHGLREPALLHDQYARTLEWMDYWVRGIASDRMLKRYGPPRKPPQ